MESINVCFSTANGFVSRAIRWVTRSTVSHSLITFRDQTLGSVFVMEANGRGFMMVPWSKWRQSHTLVERYRFSIPVGKQKFALRYVAQDLGAEYDYVSIVGFLVRRWFKRLRNPLNNPNKLICSEVVAKFLLNMGLKEFERPETWTPEDLRRALQEVSKAILVESST